MTVYAEVDCPKCGDRSKYMREHTPGVSVILASPAEEEILSLISPGRVWRIGKCIACGTFVIAGIRMLYS